MILTEEDIARMPEREKRELIRGENARAEFAIFEQQQLQKALRYRPGVQDGALGRKVLTVGPQMAAQLRVREGWDCFHDPDFIKSLLKDNGSMFRPVLAERAVAVRVDGLRDRNRAPARAHARLGGLEHEREREHDYETGQHEGGAGHATQGDPAGPSHTVGGTSSGHETAGASLVLSKPGSTAHSAVATRVGARDMCSHGPAGRAGATTEAAP